MELKGFTGPVHTSLCEWNGGSNQVGDSADPTDFLKGQKVPKKSKERLEKYLSQVGS